MNISKGHLRDLEEFSKTDEFSYEGAGCYETVNGRKIYIAGDLRDGDMYRGEFPFVGYSFDCFTSWSEMGHAAIATLTEGEWIVERLPHLNLIGKW